MVLWYVKRAVEMFGNEYYSLRQSDVFQVARGDLGVEIPYSKVFAAQKKIVSACNAIGKPGTHFFIVIRVGLAH